MVSETKPAMFQRYVMCIALLLNLVLSISANAQDSWLEFRGPSADGHAAKAKLPETINDSNVVWKTPIRGKGWSSPVVLDDQIWMTTATPDGSKMWAICCSLKTGEIIHDLLLLENKEVDFCHSMNSFASPTPVLEKGRVYVHFGRYGTFCIDTETGKEIWARKDFECDHWRGPASSPIVHDGKLFVAFDGADKQYVVALDCKSGQTIWKRDREIDYGTDNGDFKKGYGTGAIFKVNEKPVLVYPSAIATIAYRPADGETVWTVYHEGMNVSARPIQTPGGLLVISNGMGKLIGMRPDGDGNVTDSHVEWMLSKSVSRKASQIIVDGLMYMADEKGVMSCVEPETGEVVWQERVGGSFAASPIAADDKIYFFEMKKGAIHVIRPGRKFDPISQTKMDDGFMASPAVVGNTMILRSKSNLFRIEEK